MQQEGTMQGQASPVEKFVADVFDMEFIYGDSVISEDGTSVSHHGNGFHFELSGMYRDGNSQLSRTVEYTARIPCAADDGGARDVTIESIEKDGQRAIVIYDIYQPSVYLDDDWVCSGMLKVILTDAGDHSDRLKKEVEDVKRDAMSHVKNLAVRLLKGAADGQELANLVRDMLVEIAGNTRYVLDKNANGITCLGNIDAARSLYEAGQEIGKMLDRSWAGAYIAEILVKHPQVESFTMEFKPTQEYDDNNYYIAKNINIVDLRFANGVPSVIVEDSEGEEVDPEQYAEYILDEIRDIGLECDLYDGFSTHEMADEDFEVKVSRTALKGLIEQDTIDGLAVAKIVLASGMGA